MRQPRNRYSRNRDEAAPEGLIEIPTPHLINRSAEMDRRVWLIL